MILSEINIFPIKSLKGISVENSLIEERGLQFDRRWMLVDAENRLLTQREFPKMATLKVSVNKDSLIVSDNLEIPFEFAAEKTDEVMVWNNRVPAKFYNGKINRWFSDFLETDCSLVLMPEETKRMVDENFAVRKSKDIVSFADGYPFLLIGESSLAELNSRLEKPVPMNRFRPNLVVKDATAFAEDAWKKIKIGKTVFHVVKPCARCVMTTVNQTTGEKDGKEPLKTLATFRTINNRVLFGQNLIAENVGNFIKIGDKVEVLETK